MEETFGVLCRDRERQGQKREGRGGMERMERRGREGGVRHVEKDGGGEGGRRAEEGRGRRATGPKDR